jgi:hypothetical protein
MQISSLDNFFLNKYLSEIKYHTVQSKVSSLKNLFPLIYLLLRRRLLHFNTKHFASYLSIWS